MRTTNPTHTLPESDTFPTRCRTADTMCPHRAVWKLKLARHSRRGVPEIVTPTAPKVPNAASRRHSHGADRQRTSEGYRMAFSARRGDRLASACHVLRGRAANHGRAAVGDARPGGNEATHGGE